MASVNCFDRITVVVGYDRTVGPLEPTSFFGQLIAVDPLLWSTADACRAILLSMVDFLRVVLSVPSRTNLLRPLLPLVDLLIDAGW
jgi:hypothetical protein